MTLRTNISRGIGNIRNLFPFSHEGRQTLIYVCIAWAAPVLCGMLVWEQSRIEVFPGAAAEQRLARFADISDRVSWGLMVILVAFACFVSIRAIKIGKDGFSAESRDNAASAAQEAADAAQTKADEIKETT
jgi:hypothetical protein